jgi:hypothetical protein
MLTRGKFQFHINLHGFQANLNICHINTTMSRECKFVVTTDGFSTLTGLHSGSYSKAANRIPTHGQWLEMMPSPRLGLVLKPENDLFIVMLTCCIHGNTCSNMAPQ